MKRFVGPQEKSTQRHSHFWRCVLLSGLFALLLTLIFAANFAIASPAFATVFAASRSTFTTSPTRGPVGAVIVVTGKGVGLPDGTEVDLGYTADFQNCNILSGGRPGVVQNGAFSGWFRWPAGTGKKSFGVCVSTGNSFAFQVGSYQVLSDSTPHISVVPTVPNAGKQATVSGENFFPAGTSVNLVWRSKNGGESVSLGMVSSDGAGAFTHTFTVPSHASTGSYMLTGVVGSGSPPTLSAVAAFQVSGITIVAVPTSTASPTPTATPTSVATAPATATPHAVIAHRPASADANLASKTGMLLPVALAGTLLIALALGAGVLVVRRQRSLVASSQVSSGVLSWSDVTPAPTGSPPTEAGAFMPWTGTIYPGGHSPVGNPGMEYSPLPEPVVPPPRVVWNKTPTIPFDPGLAEAMREAQVSLFAMPRPPVSEEVEAQSGIPRPTSGGL